AVRQPLLAGIEPKDDVGAVAADDLRIGAGRTRDLAALADLELDVVDDGADRNVGERHGVAGLYVDIFAGHHRVAGGKALRRQDVGEFAVLVFDQCDEAGAVRIVFEALDLGRRVEPAALEVDLAVGLLVAAAAVARGDAPAVVAAAARIRPLGQRLYRRTGMKAGAVDEDELPLARRDRIVALKCHRAPLPTFPWSRRCADPLPGSRWRAWFPPAARSGRGTPSTCRA